MSLFINLRQPRDFTSHTSRRGTLYITRYIFLSLLFKNIFSKRVLIAINYAKYVLVYFHVLCSVIDTTTTLDSRVFAKIPGTFQKFGLPSAKIRKLPSHQVFGVFALKVNKILKVMPSKLRREMGMCAITIYVQQQQ